VTVVRLGDREPIEPQQAQPEQVPRRAEQRRLWRLRLILPFLILLAFFAWGFTTNYIPSRSMLPTLKPGDHILTMRAWLAYPRDTLPARGDIITFLPPEQVLNEEAQSEGARDLRPEVWIKRVVGLPGETVWVFGGNIYINGSPLPRQFYRGHPNVYQYNYPFASLAPLTLGAGQLFVIGDNPDESDDSRSWGPLTRDRVVGKFVAVLFNEGEGGPNQRRAEMEEGW